MDTIAWDDKYSLNIERLDKQHRQFVFYLARMQQAIRRREGHAAVRQTFQDLAEYADRHFRDEEDMFKLSAFPELDLQKRQHGYFTMQVRAMKDAYLGEKKLPPETLLNFLADWLIHHILEEDKKFAAFLASRG